MVNNLPKMRDQGVSGKLLCRLQQAGAGSSPSRVAFLPNCQGAKGRGCGVLDYIHLFITNVSQQRDIFLGICMDRMHSAALKKPKSRDKSSHSKGKSQSGGESPHSKEAA